MGGASSSSLAMTLCLAVLAIAPNAAESFLTQVVDRWKEQSEIRYEFRTVRVAKKTGKSDLLEKGRAFYHRQSEFFVELTDVQEKIRGTVGRDPSGERYSNAVGGSGVGTANTALGFGDSIPAHWAYQPVLVADSDELGRFHVFHDSTPKAATFRGNRCWLTVATEGNAQTTIWWDEKTLFPIRIQEDWPKWFRVTVFEKVKLTK